MISRAGKIYFIVAAVSLVSFVLVRFLSGGWVPFLWVCLAALVGALFMAVWKDRSFYHDFFTMKTTKKGMSMGGLILTVVVFLIAVNFIAVRKYKTFDFSAAGVNTLSDQSLKLLKGLSEDLRVIYFYQSGEQGVEENRHAFIELMKKYQDQSDKVKLEFVDVNERPDMAEEFGVSKGNGSVFLDYHGRHSQIQKIEEQDVTSAIVKVTREHDKLVYMITGHGELDVTDSKEADGGAFVKQMLEQNRYTVKELNLTNQTEVPKDADVVLLLGPRQAMLDNEIQALESYLQRGGSLILALKSKAKHNLSGFIGKYGLVAENDYIFNVADTPLGRAISNPRMTIGSSFPPGNSITRPFGKAQFVVFHMPQQIKVAEKIPEGLKIDTLVQTSSDAMAAPNLDFKGLGKLGIFSIVQMVSGKLEKDAPGEMHLVVLGDSDIFGNQLIYQNLNRDLLLNTAAYLAKEETLITITPKEVGITDMQLTPLNFALYLLGFALVLPLAFLGASITLWFKRRYA